ncbi:MULTISPECIES: DMT family transporter [Stenotrophomonas]|uniref:DMT family transporter n=1 Tax=Stenotrophomonas TaxID=40323 RepID=UPI001C8C7B75|nr:SMR family transporter [Stenotrophomonas maltophilia]
MIGWIYLLLAGLLEVGVVVGIREVSAGRYLRGIPLHALGMSSSLYLLYLAMNTIDISIAYAAYTGIGVLGTVVVGMAFWDEKASLRKIGYLALMVSALTVMKLAG